MKLKYLFCLYFLFLMNMTLLAQSSRLRVRRFEDVSSAKQYACHQPRKDVNGEPAALVLVQVLVANSHVTFISNNLLGNVEKKSSEYWVYMTAGAKSLDIHCAGIGQIGVFFSELSNGTIPSLSKQCTYELVISYDEDIDIEKLKQELKEEILAELLKEQQNANNITSTSILPPSISQKQLNIHNGYEYVDLGLSVKWATCNVGASKPEEYGDYFAWGETKAKSDYGWIGYKYSNGLHEYLTKYCDSHSHGYNDFMDNKIQLELSDDVAAVNWGGNWRMPTEAEQDELYTECMWTWIIQEGVYGYRVTSKKNGNSIFLPAAGYRHGSNSYNVGSHGYYWSNLLYKGFPSGALYIYFISSSVHRDYRGRFYGLPVRAVCE